MKPDMLHAVWTAVNRVSRTGVVIGEDQKIGVYAVSYTHLDVYKRQAHTANAFFGSGVSRLTIITK